MENKKIDCKFINLCDFVTVKDKFGNIYYTQLASICSKVTNICFANQNFEYLFTGDILGYNIVDINNQPLLNTYSTIKNNVGIRFIGKIYFNDTDIIDISKENCIDDFAKKYNIVDENNMVETTKNLKNKITDLENKIFNLESKLNNNILIQYIPYIPYIETPVIYTNFTFI